MPGDGFADFFRQATDMTPFPYQQRLATGESLPVVLHAPTGAGKTAASVLGWLWRRRFHPHPAVRLGMPRRLVYCLPMRVLVEQTHREAGRWLARLGLAGEVGLHLLLGGSSDDDWLLHPERDAVIVGTQDMLISRALNRGYGMSRFRWPQAFGLLNSDCLWVLDEVQLMGPSLPTSLQLQGFRRRFGTAGPVHTLWMSATLAPEWLSTVDHAPPTAGQILTLSPADRAHADLGARLTAAKRLRQVDVGGVRDRAYARRLASLLVERHLPGSLTLAIVNTVERAQALYREIEALVRNGGPQRLLLHSRFRPPDRQALTGALADPLPPEGRIVVSTQVVEAGVDLSARTLFTELAPWPSLVQRFGRCNRRGENREADILWADVADRDAAPYAAAELGSARAALDEMEGRSVAPASLPDVQMAPPAAPAIRARDLTDLFDTMPDLSGNDVDVSRFIREANDLDVSVFWRRWEDGAAPQETEPTSEELCPVPIAQVREFLRHRQAWAWDHLGERWRGARADDVRPGALLLLHAGAGGYTPERGWDASSRQEVRVVGRRDAPAPEAVRDDPLSFRRQWQTLTAHTDAVVAAVDRLLAALPSLQDHAPALMTAARWHDAGKAHPVFQATMQAAGPPERSAIWAKAAGSSRRHGRRHFRHELASALALLQQPQNLPPLLFDLAVYLAGSHHGRVRLAIRALPEEEGAGRHALGVWEGDRLPAADLGGGIPLPETTLDLACMDLGRWPADPPTWLERALALRDALGPFRLAYLEACLRAADSRASAAAEEVPGHA